jgi:DNA-binding CsgD family transcriptional regulator
MNKDRRALNATEKQIVYHLCDQKTSKEIGEIMGKTPRTIDSSRATIMIKTDSSTIAGVIIYAIKNQIYQL